MLRPGQSQRGGGLRRDRGEWRRFTKKGSRQLPETWMVNTTLFNTTPASHNSNGSSKDRRYG